MTLAEATIRGPSRRQAATAAIAYVVYFVLAGVGQATGSIALTVIGTASYFLVAVALWLVFASAGARVGAAALAFAAIGCVVQGIGQARSDLALQTAALAFFGGFEIALAYLIVRSPFAPRSLGAALAIAGAADVVAVMVPLPDTVRFAVVALGGLAELALLVWLIARAVRRPV